MRQVVQAYYSTVKAMRPIARRDPVQPMRLHARLEAAAPVDAADEGAELVAERVAEVMLLLVAVAEVELLQRMVSIGSLMLIGAHSHTRARICDSAVETLRRPITIERRVNVHVALRELRK